MRRALLIALLAALSMPGVATAAPDPTTDAEFLRIASEAFPDSLCAGQLEIIWDATLPARRADTGYHVRGEATGRVFMYGEWRSISCQMTLDPALREEGRACDAAVHEAGHLAGIDDHTETGIMQAMLTEWPACHPPKTRRERAFQMIREELCDPAWRINCDRRVRRCVARRPGARYARYFTVYGDGLEGGELRPVARRAPVRRVGKR